METGKNAYIVARQKEETIENGFDIERIAVLESELRDSDRILHTYHPGDTVVHDENTGDLAQYDPHSDISIKPQAKGWIPVKITTER